MQDSCPSLALQADAQAFSTACLDMTEVYYMSFKNWVGTVI